MKLRALPLALALAACSEPPCDDARAPSRPRLGCPSAFQAQAARPLDTSLPGAYTVKTIVDGADGDRVHFLDTTTYPMHRAFAVAHLGYPVGQPFSGEYFLPDRRLLLGAVTRYEEPGLWTYELAPYDTATPEQVARAFRLLRDAAFFGGALRLHPGSVEQAARLLALPADVPRVSTEELLRGTSYQVYNPGVAVGRLRRRGAAELSAPVDPLEILVLDHAPPDLPVVAGLITEEPQPRLAYANTLSRERRAPSLALRDARARLAPYEGQWVRLEAGEFAHRLSPATQAEAEARWAGSRPGPVAAPAPDLARAGLPALDELRLGDIAAVGGAAAHLGELGRGQGVRVPAGFAIPVRYFKRFMADQGFDAELAALAAAPRFTSDAAYRQQALTALQARMRAAPLDAALVQMVVQRGAQDLPGVTLALRSSATIEGLPGHSGAGLYESALARPGDPGQPVAQAILRVWASLYAPRAYEERARARIDEARAAMGVLVHAAHTDAVAAGAALTSNPFDDSPGGEDALLVTAQRGAAGVVRPPPGVSADQLLYFHYHVGQPSAYLGRSSLAAGAPVLPRAQLFELGQQLDAARARFAPLYPGQGGAPPRLVVEFLVRGAAAEIEIIDARPYPARGQEM